MTLVERRKPRQRQPPSNERFELPQPYEPEEPQEGLQQIPGTPFFTTPNEPADPRDCNRYPNSPWCGENPISLDNIVDIGVDLVLDECNIGIQLAPTLAFVALPPIQLVYRREGCIKPPPPPPMNKREFWQEFPTIRGDINNGKEFIGFVSRWRYFEDGNGLADLEVSASLVQFQRNRYQDKPIRGIPTDAKLTLFISFLYRRTGRWVRINNNGDRGLIQRDADIFLSKGGTITGDIFDDESEWLQQTDGDISLYYRLGYSDVNADIPVNLRNAGINGNEFLVFRFRPVGGASTGVPLQLNFDSKSGFPFDFYRIYKSGDYTEEEGTQTFWFQADWKPSIPPPELYKMSCCENNDRLLRLLLARVGQFPVTVPDSYLTIEGSEPKDKTINSLMELTGWFATRMDEVIGQFEITVEIDDADLTKEGKQKKTIRLPNLSEAIAEIFTMTFQQTIYTDLMIHMLTDSLAESAQIKQMDFKNNHALMAIAEYMGFSYKTINQKLPLTFTPGAGTFEELLKETEIEVGVIDYQEKGSLLQHINTLLQAAAIIRAVHYRRAPKDEEGLKQQLREDLVGIAGNRIGNLREMIKEYMEDVNKQYDSTEDSKPTQ